MTSLDSLLMSVVEDPGDHASWFFLADFLEEQGWGPEAELTRIRETLRRWNPAHTNDAAMEKRMQDLLLAGVRPIMPSLRVDLGWNVEMTFHLIPPGTFWMGRRLPDGESGQYDNELPRHPVRLTQGFWLGRTPVTTRQWHAAMHPDTNPPEEDHPITGVSWLHVVRLCSVLRDRHELDFRLPSEAEWEYACRAGTTSPFHSGSTEADALRAGWHQSSSRSGPQPVGRKEPNAWGLQDMHGNVWEWCLDGKRNYRTNMEVDPVHELELGTARVLRGGSYQNNWTDARSACRGWANHGETASHWGCRLAIPLKPGSALRLPLAE